MSRFWQSVAMVGFVTAVDAVAMELNVAPPSVDFSIATKTDPSVAVAAA